MTGYPDRELTERQDDIFRDLGKMVIAGIHSRGDAFSYAERVAAALGIGWDDDEAAAEAALRNALTPVRVPEPSDQAETART